MPIDYTHKPSHLTVVKIGGAVVDDPEALNRFLADFVRISGHKLLVHGGGRAASTLCRRLDIPVKMVDGRRITDRPALDVATMVYAGLVNKQIVARLQSLRCNALGLCGADGGAIRAVKRPVGEIDYGFVGDVAEVDYELFGNLIHSDLVPVVAPITHDSHGNLLNTNADTVAQAIAEALADRFHVELIYCFEQPGVLADPADPSSLIPRIDPSLYALLKADGVVSGGMIPKLDNAFKALAGGVGRVVIKDSANLLRNTGTSIEPLHIR